MTSGPAMRNGYFLSALLLTTIWATAPARANSCDSLVASYNAIQDDTDSRIDAYKQRNFGNERDFDEVYDKASPSEKARLCPKLIAWAKWQLNLYRQQNVALSTLIAGLAANRCGIEGAPRLFDTEPTERVLSLLSCDRAK